MDFPEEHRRNVERLLRTCKELREEAEKNGLTEETLAEMLAEIRRNQRTRAEFSGEEYAQYRREKAQEFLRLREQISAEAAANGLTEEILAEILAER